MSYGFRILVEGDFACFTRPEMKVERVSYDVPTPGALEGMLKSVYWKPPIRYVIDKLVVYHPIDFLNIRRNEVKSALLYSKVKAQMRNAAQDISLYADKMRHQRAAMILRNVKYGSEFHFEMTGIRDEEEQDSEKKHYNLIKRRLEKGQFFRQPCFGCSEFPVKRMELIPQFDPEEIDPEVRTMGDVDLGYMLYRMEFEDGGIPKNGDWERRQFSDQAKAVYYRPHMINGIIDVARYREGITCRFRHCVNIMMRLPEKEKF